MPRRQMVAKLKVSPLRNASGTITACSPAAAATRPRRWVLPYPARGAVRSTRGAPAGDSTAAVSWSKRLACSPGTEASSATSRGLRQTSLAKGFNRGRPAAVSGDFGRTEDACGNSGLCTRAEVVMLSITQYYLLKIFCSPKNKSGELGNLRIFAFSRHISQITRDSWTL